MKIFTIIFLIMGMPIFGNHSPDNNHSMSASSSVFIEDKNSSKKSKSLFSMKRVVREPDVIVYIKGMVCSFCAQGIKKSFLKEKMIKDVNVRLENGSVELKLKAFRKISSELISKIIQDAGYEVKKIEKLK